METKWCDIRVKNLLDVNLKKWDIVNVDYSEYAQENDKVIFIDYEKLAELWVWAKIKFEQSNILLEITEIKAVFLSFECFLFFGSCCLWMSFSSIFQRL